MNCSIIKLGIIKRAFLTEVSTHHRIKLSGIERFRESLWLDIPRCNARLGLLCSTVLGNDTFQIYDWKA